MAHGAAAQNEVDDEVSGIRLGPALRLQPSLGIQVQFTDNRFRTPDNEVSETGVRFDPALILSYTPSAGSFNLGYKGQIDPVAEEDYEDREFFLTGDIRPLLRHRFEFDARHQRDHDELGLARTQGIADPESLDLDEWDESGIHGQYTFGAPEARINLSVRGGLTDREYQTNRDATRFLDYKTTLVGGGLAYRVGTRTQLVLDYERSEYEYDTDFMPSFDSTLQRGLVGVRWLATAKTTGEVLVGYFEREFDSNLRQNGDGVDWRAQLTWAPVTRTQFTFTTGRLIQETVLLGESFVNEQLYQIAWRQDWTSRFFSTLTGTQYQAKYEGISRDDDASKVLATLNYELSRKFTLKGGYEYTTRDSSDNLRDYDRNVLFQGFEFVF